VGGQPLRHPTGYTHGAIPARTPESDALSKDLKRRGFAFVGSTICYAFMQSVGMVNDHLADCPARGRIAPPPTDPTRPRLL
jgi:DNA-3-methyladenine glycosylase I